MMTSTSQTSILLLLLLSAIMFHKSMSTTDKVVHCNVKDRGTLVMFKQGIIDSFGWLSTWSTEEDCCQWKGVFCDNITGRVTKLDLSPPFEELHRLGGEINFVFLELEFLNYVDLSQNRFNVTSLPPIGDNFTHASNLQYLDLSFNYNLQMDNLNWLSPLSSLKYLNLSLIDIHKETNWLQLVAIPSLSELHLAYCNLSNISPSLMYVNFTSLVTLDLSFNHFNSKLPYWIGQLEQLQHLDFSYNMFHGPIPSTLGNLSSLVSLNVGSNFFSGAIFETFFSKLSNLKGLYLSNSTFEFHLDPEWIPPFQLNDLFLGNTNQGPGFPSWIYTPNSLQNLDLSSSRISLACGDKFRRLLEGISYLYLSDNSISGDISSVTLNSVRLALDHNNFTGGLPHISPMAEYVELSHNSFSGSIPRGWEDLKHLYYINLWNNKLRGEVLVHLSSWKQLQFMVLGKNNFSGTIPIKMPQHLEVIVLRDNQFVGNLSPQLFNLSRLYHLDLAYNGFSGSMPYCAYNLTQMVTFVPGTWLFGIGTIELFTKGHEYEYVIDIHRRTIDLSANNLSGEIPLELFRLTQVQTLNLSHNSLSGKIPKVIGDMKNLESLDLSNNKLFGEVPQSMALLTFLGYLNLSSNNFNGRIPTGSQLQSFNSSSYIENPKLCGAPLKNCSVKGKNHKTLELPPWNEDADPFIKSLYLGMGVGFAVGFWGICSSLVLIRKWRHMCFRFLDLVTDQLYVTLMVKLNRFRRIWGHTT